MPIHVLPPEVAAKIAAGEVVERPASAAKELLENAIDAGATDIRLEIRQGGKRLIRVSDNGCGIPAAEVELAFARHATSKLAAAEELDRIRTLGFRGEALASIAAVSHFTMSTRAASEEVGVRVRLEGGAIVHREGYGGPAGTTVAVENLYYNTPARSKFLRADSTEMARIAEVVTSYALAYPELRFTLLKDDRLALQTTGSGQLADVLAQVHGLEVARRMLACQETVDEIAVAGYISAPELNRSDRGGLMFFVNRRWVQDRSLSFAVEEAYRGLLLKDRHPWAVLDIRLDPGEVDVNIHPTKREVRFSDARRVFSAVQRAVRHTLQADAPIPTVASAAAPVTWGGWERAAASYAPPRPHPGQLGLELQRTADVEVSDLRPAERLPMLRVVGQIAQTYIIAEGPGGMYLIDQHAAHERIVYERMMGQRAAAAQSAAPVASQPLLDPAVVELTLAQGQELEEHLADLAALGFDIVPFGPSAYRIQAVPVSLLGGGLPAGDPAAALREILAEAEGSDRPWDEAALITLVCHSAVRAGQTLSPDEMRDLVRQLEQTDTPHSCPHGRPTMIHLSASQLEREFGRR